TIAVESVLLGLVFDLVQATDHRQRRPGIGLVTVESLEEAAPRMRPAADLDDAVLLEHRAVARVRIDLQQAEEVAEEVPRSITTAPDREVEHDFVAVAPPIQGPSMERAR